MRQADPANPDPVYLDYAATTPVDARVADRMARCLTTGGDFGNPGSVSHAYGEKASALVEGARAQVAAAVGAEPADILWTSGATEANNLALFGTAYYYRDVGRHIVTSRTEHKAVLDPCRELERRGWQVTYLVPGCDGVIQPAQVEAALRPDTVLVSVMHVNNETGAISDVPAIAAVCARHGRARFHVDAAQSVGKRPVDFGGWGVDLLSLSAHKAYGPKGVGALAVARRRRVQLQPLQFGGGQERNLRSGTVATHQVVGMGAAFELAAAALHEESARVERLRALLWEGLARLGGVLRNGAATQTVAQVLNLSFPGVEGESLLAAVRGAIAVSTGSACMSATGESSYVLRALGRDERLAESSLRLSLGRFSTDADIHTAIQAVSCAVRYLRRVAGGMGCRPDSRAPEERARTEVPGGTEEQAEAERQARTEGQSGAEERASMEGQATAEWQAPALEPRAEAANEPGNALEEAVSGRRPENYNDLTWRHFSRAGYCGRLAGRGVHRGAAGSPAQGVWVQFDLRVGEGGSPAIQEARFQAYGCPHVIAIADWLAQTSIGGEVRPASPSPLPEPVAALRERFDMPVDKMGRLLLVEDAWAAALSSVHGGKRPQAR